MKATIDICLYDNEAHRSQVIELWETVFGYSSTYNKPERSIDAKIAENDGLFFVAVDKSAGPGMAQEAKIAGTTMAGYDGHRGWIYAVAVSPEYRKTGLGSLLLSHAEKVLRNLGCPKINLQVRGDNTEVVDFYKKNGYVVEDRVSMGKIVTLE